MSTLPAFADLPAVATHLRTVLDGTEGSSGKRYCLLYAYNGVGKTRLSMAFKELGRNGDDRDTLYFNAFTEDLFSWDNDLDADQDRRLKINRASRFFDALVQLEMDNRIRPLLQRYVDFDFRIDTEEWVVRFSRRVGDQDIDNIKVSRGEENIFIWCFFLVALQLVLDKDPVYEWVKYVYIDDPISSLDEHNAIAIANHLGQMLKLQSDSSASVPPVKVVISSHHTLFFNVLCNELSKARKYFLGRGVASSGYLLREIKGDTPFYHHVAALCELYQAAHENRLYTHHFNMLRTILEKAASFHGYENFSACLKRDDDDPDGVLHARLLNILSHGNYSLYEPQEMLEENKVYFRKILEGFLRRYPFNPHLFPEFQQAPTTP